MKKVLHILLIGFLIGWGFTPQSAKASHIAGADVTYECLGGDSFLITVNVFRDCGGISFTWSPNDVEITSACGTTINGNSLTWTQTNIPDTFQFADGGTEVSQLCNVVLDSSECRYNGPGEQPGLVRYTYEAVVVLAPPCSSWTIGFEPPPARNTLLNTNAGGLYVESTIEVDSICNSSPYFTADPIPYVCLNQLATYNFGVIEPDGDSLVYSFAPGFTGPGVNITYPNSTPFTNPLQTYSTTPPTIDPLTGLVTFTPNQTGNLVVVVQVQEYRNGVLIGTVLRDIQFVVQACPTNQQAETNNIVTFSGTGSQLDSNSVEVCTGENFTFEVLFYDPNPTDSLTATSNISSVLPGATMNVSHPNAPASYDTMIVTVSWTAVPVNGNFYSFFVQANDNACPISGITAATFDVTIVQGVFAGSDIIICKNSQSASYTARGGSSFTWSALPGGDSLIVGTNFSCDTCQTITASPTQTTCYEVVSNLNTACKNRDTVCVIVAKDYNLIHPVDTAICFGDSITLPMQADDSTLTYSYNWSPDRYILDSDTLQNPRAFMETTKNFQVTVTSDSGCQKTANFDVIVTPPFPANFRAFALDSVSCSGVSTKLDAFLGESVVNCGISNAGCEIAQIPVTIGSGLQSNAGGTMASPLNWPTPYGSMNNFMKAQFLIRASELNAAGIKAGKLTSLAFDIVSMNQGDSTFNDFEIRMTCTNDTSMGIIWNTNVQTVFNAKTINVQPGWNEHQFDNGFAYDGTSNIIVQICFSNLTGNSPTNISTRLSNTSYNSSLYLARNNTIACLSTSVDANVDRRPNMRFDWCASIDSSAYVYNWFPDTNISNPNMKNPSVTITEPITYYLALSDTFGVCNDTASVDILISDVDAGKDTLVCQYDTFQLNGSMIPSCPGGDTLIYWTPSIGLDNDSILNPNAVLANDQTYVLHVTDDCGCTKTDTVTISVQNLGPPMPRKKDPSCGENDGEFVLTLNEGFPPYQYSIDGGVTYFADSLFDSLSVGFYNLTMIDSMGCPSDTILDTLYNPGAPFIDSVLSSDLTCFKSADGSLEVFASAGTPPYIYSLDSGRTYQANAIFSGLDAGTYTVFAASTDTCTSFPVLVELTQPDSFYIDSFAFFNDTCFQLCNGYAGLSVLGGTTPYNYNWSAGGPSSPNISNLCAGNYTVQITDSNNCLIDTSFIIQEPDPVIFDSILVSPITCFGFDNGKIDLFVSGGSQGYQYSLDGGITYSTDNLNDSLQPQAYSIAVKDSFSCMADTVIDIIEPPKVTVQTPFDSTIICVSTCVDLTAVGGGGNGAPYTFSWAPVVPDTNINRVCPTRPTNYAVYAKDPLGCSSDPALIFVDLYDSLQLNLINDTFTCSGDPLQLYAAATGGDSAQYYFEWNPFIGLNNPIIDSPTFFFEESITYTVLLSDACGSPPVTEEVTITVNPTPNVAFTSDKDIDCEPAEILFTNQSSSASECIWSFGDGRSAPGCQFIQYVYEQDGEYDVTLTVTSPEGCEASLTKEEMITINRTPTAIFTMNPEVTSVLNTEIEFEDLSRGPIQTWLWNFGAQDVSSERDPTYIFPNEDTATYPVKLTVTSPKGCFDDTIRYVRIASDFTVFVPTAFTPAVSQGLNDLFKPVMVGVQPTEYLFNVYDRWGKIVFSTQDVNAGWDGYVNGNLAPTGQYVWKLVLGDFTSDREGHEYMGHVTIIR